MNELRWLLAGLAVLTVVGLYAYSRVKRAREDKRFWAGHQIPDPDAKPNTTDAPVHASTDSLDPEAIESVGTARVVSRADDYASQIDDLQTGGNEAAAPQSGPENELTVVHYLVRSNGEPFPGAELYREAEKAGLVFSPMGTLDCIDADSGKPLFSVANAVGDGKIPKGELDDFSTPGLVLFMRLPGPCAGVKAYYQMLDCAGRLVEAFAADVLDEDRARLNEQGARHNQDRLAAFDARQTVAG